MYFPLFVGVLCLDLFCYALLCVHSSVAIILKRKRKLVAFLLLSYRCNVTINVLWLFLTLPWVGLQCVIVVLPGHTHLLFYLFAGLRSAVGDVSDCIFVIECRSSGRGFDPRLDPYFRGD